MRRDQLEHILRAAGAVIATDEFIVIGSQAIVGAVDGALPEVAVLSIEADLVPIDDVDGEKANLLDGTIGELSMFHETFGIYAQGVGETTARLPAGWKDRLVALRSENTRGVTGWCLDPVDLVVSKLLAGREKDLDFCGALLAAGVVAADDVRARAGLLEASQEESELLLGRVDRLSAGPAT
jgi:hypothetical protein